MKKNNLKSETEMKLNKQQQWIVDYLQDRNWTSPTKIGLAYGDSAGKFYHSSWASPKCLTLTKKGILERDERGWYRLHIT